MTSETFFVRRTVVGERRASFAGFSSVGGVLDPALRDFEARDEGWSTVTPERYCCRQQGDRKSHVLWARSARGSTHSWGQI
jgi:hypothetical protein